MELDDFTGTPCATLHGRSATVDEHRYRLSMGVHSAFYFYMAGWERLWPIEILARARRDQIAAAQPVCEHALLLQLDPLSASLPVSRERLNEHRTFCGDHQYLAFADSAGKPIDLAEFADFQNQVHEMLRDPAAMPWRTWSENPLYWWSQERKQRCATITLSRNPRNNVLYLRERVAP